MGCGFAALRPRDPVQREFDELAKDIIRNDGRHRQVFINVYEHKISPHGRLHAWIDTFWGTFNHWAIGELAAENTQFVHHLQAVYRDFHGKIIHKTDPPHDEKDDEGQYLKAMNGIYNRFIHGNSAGETNLAWKSRVAVTEYHDDGWSSKTDSSIYADPKDVFAKAEQDIGLHLAGTLWTQFKESDDFKTWWNARDGGKDYIKWAKKANFQNPHPPELPAGECKVEEERRHEHEEHQGHEGSHNPPPLARGNSRSTAGGESQPSRWELARYFS